MSPLGRKACLVRHGGGLQAHRIVGSSLRQIQRSIDEGMAMTRHVSGKHTDLAIRDLPRGARVLPCHAARCFALFQETSFVDHQHRTVVRQMLDNTLAQRIGIPPIPPQKRLMAARIRIAGGLRASTLSCAAPRSAVRPGTILRSPPSAPVRTAAASVPSRSAVTTPTTCVVSIDAKPVHDCRIMVAHRFRRHTVS
jgi:hypothetical protein